ncbi:uncharacterized protein LOC144645435 [Oculina patagonica]
MKVLFIFVLVVLPCIVAAFDLGDDVTARWTNNKYYRGMVADFPAPDKIEILFDDGDQITHSIHDVSAVIYDRAPEEVYVGQHVMATWKGGVKFYIGFVTEERADGKFKVVFDDNDEDYYSADDLREFPDHESPQEVGARVFARWTNGLYYRAFVVSATDSSLSILYDDGDTITHQKSDSTAVILDVLPSRIDVATQPRVIAFWPGRVRYYPGVIEYIINDFRSSPNTLFHVQFDDGDKRDQEFYQMRILPA